MKKRQRQRPSVLVHATLLSGPLEKQSKLGLWQPRFFELAGHYLRYYSNAQQTEVLDAIDLMRVENVFGAQDSPLVFSLYFFEPGKVIKLRAPTPELACQWVQGLQGAGQQQAALALASGMRGAQGAPPGMHAGSGEGGGPDVGWAAEERGGRLRDR